MNTTRPTNRLARLALALVGLTLAVGAVVALWIARPAARDAAPASLPTVTIADLCYVSR